MAATESPDSASYEQSYEGKRGNGFLRALKAPFKALGRLFGRGKNKNDGKLHRLTEKDVRKFESAKVNRITDSRNQPEPASRIEPPTDASAGDDAQAHLEVGRELLNNGELDWAISELSIAASLNPKLSEATNLLGIAYDRKGLRQRALDSLQTSVHAEADVPMHLNNLGYLLYKNGDYKGAIKYLKRAAKLAPNDQRIWNNLGLAQSQLGKFDDAYKSFAEAGGEFDGRLNVAARLERQGFAKEAIKHLEKARSLQPGSTEVLSRLANLYQSMGKKEEAEIARSSLRSLRTVAEAPIQK
jgi:Flp pilus assembly protein TadD